MKNRLASPVVALALGLALASGPALAGEEAKVELTSNPTPAQEEALQRGDILVLLINRHPIYHVDVYGVVDAPVSQVWRTITGYDTYHKFLPLVVDSGVRKRSGETAWQYVRMEPPWPLPPLWMVNINTERRAKHHVSWTMADGNLRFERGHWQLSALGPDRTRLQFHVSADPWLEIVPPWLIEFVTRSVLPDVVKGVRQRVKQTGPA